MMYLEKTSYFLLIRASIRVQRIWILTIRENL